MSAGSRPSAVETTVWGPTRTSSLAIAAHAAARPTTAAAACAPGFPIRSVSVPPGCPRDHTETVRRPLITINEKTMSNVFTHGFEVRTILSLDYSHVDAALKMSASAYSLPSCATKPVDSFSCGSLVPSPRGEGETSGSVIANMEAQATPRRRGTAQRTAVSGREASHSGPDAGIVAGTTPSVVHEVQPCATTGVGVSQPPSPGAAAGKAACASGATQSGIGHLSPVPSPDAGDAEASVTRACDGCQSEQAARMAEDTARQRTEIGVQRGGAVAP